VVRKAFKRMNACTHQHAGTFLNCRAAPWEIGNEEAAEDAEAPGKFASYQDTVLLRQGKQVPKRGPVSPCLEKEAAAAGDDSGRRVRFQPRMRDGNAQGATEAPPTLQAGASSVFTVGKEPSDECGMFRCDAGSFLLVLDSCCSDAIPLYSAQPPFCVPPGARVLIGHCLTAFARVAWCLSLPYIHQVVVP
jgi:hypothetical protein